jgi:hypothetical protein
MASNPSLGPADNVQNRLLAEIVCQLIELNNHLDSIDSSVSDTEVAVTRVTDELIEIRGEIKNK